MGLYACDEASLFTVCCLDDGKRMQEEMNEKYHPQGDCSPGAERVSGLGLKGFRAERV